MSESWSSSSRRFSVAWIVATSALGDDSMCFISQFFVRSTLCFPRRFPMLRGTSSWNDVKESNPIVFVYSM